MRALNGTRLVVAGVVAGVVLMIVHGINESVLAAEYQGLLDRLGGSLPSAAGVALLFGAALASGIAFVWFYALAIERYGPGAGPALRVALGAWLLACLVPNLGLLAYGVLSPRFFWLASAADLMAIPLAVLAGARVYSWNAQPAVEVGAIGERG